MAVRTIPSNLIVRKQSQSGGGTGGGDTTTYYPYNVLALKYIDNISINTFESFSESVKAKPDGTKVYLYGTGTGSIQQFSLSTPWDISTLTLETSSPSLDPQDSFGTVIFFKPDGTKVYFATQNKTIHQYTLTTPWDVSTLTYDNVSLDYTTSPLDSYSKNMFIDNEGSSVYMSNQDTIMRFEMSTPWDISTATYQEMFTTTARPDGIVEGISLNTDENKMIVVEVVGEFDTYIDQYDLSAPNSLASPTYVSTYTVDTSVTQLSEDIYIDTLNGNEVLILGASKVHRFQFSQEPVTETFVCCPEWVDLGAEQYGQYNVTVGNSVIGTASYYNLYEPSPTWAFTTTNVRGVGDLYVYDGSAYPSGAGLRRSSTTIDGTFYSPDSGFIVDEVCVYVEFISNNEIGTGFDIDFVVNAYNLQGGLAGSTDASITQVEYQANPSKVYQISIPLAANTDLNEIEFVSQSYPTAIIRDIRVCKDGALVDYPFQFPT